MNTTKQADLDPITALYTPPEEIPQKSKVLSFVNKRLMLKSLDIFWNNFCK